MPILSPRSRRQDGDSYTPLNKMLIASLSSYPTTPKTPQIRNCYYVYGHKQALNTKQCLPYSQRSYDYGVCRNTSFYLGDTSKNTVAVDLGYQNQKIISGTLIASMCMQDFTYSFMWDFTSRRATRMHNRILKEV